MKRSAIAALSVLLLALPLIAEAQLAGRVYRLGMLHFAGAEQAVAMPPSLILAFLRRAGYVEGHNLVIERRSAEGKPERLPSHARDLVQLRVDVIVAFTQAAVQAARDATETIPIVIFAAADPVAQGWATSLARPGSNVTGVVITPGTQLADKRVELIKEMVPRATRIVVLANAEPHVRDQVREAQKAASSLGVELVVADVRDDDYERPSRASSPRGLTPWSGSQARVSPVTGSGSSSWPQGTDCL